MSTHTYPQSSYNIEVCAGTIPYNTEVIHKFGRNDSVSTTFVPISVGGLYRTPQVSGATALRIKAGGNANDTAAGSGAREITLVGLDETGAQVTETLATNGASASSNTTTTFLRLFRYLVSASGTYATAAAGSHSGDIVIENAAGTEDWATIDSTTFARGQSEIGAYTIPLGKTGYILSINMNTDSTKTATLLFFQRQNILETSAPYTAMREVIDLSSLEGANTYAPNIPIGPFPALTDVGLMGKFNAGSGTMDVDFEILLQDA